ncbi:hypothetical protein CGMCC3_g1960 [Colletotrichum fructicola]|nr:uncharacterized protein CGMCC3_g1960 [Colletotrichum fructicola]KAE9581752.1 hypothetical protein CGMCC3_g1960 [Colletotrichum fructicola]
MAAAIQFPVSLRIGIGNWPHPGSEVHPWVIPASGVLGEVA